MKITEEHIVGALVADDYRTASVFKSFGIDFCCKGNRSIRDVCESKHIDPEFVIKQLEHVVSQQEAGVVDFKSWPADLLAEYIEKKHHAYVVHKTQEILPFLNKVMRVHGERHPELIEIGSLFMASAGELAQHMKKEELILFPFIKQLVKADKDGAGIAAPHFGTVENPIAMMHEEHDLEGERFRKIAALSNSYTPPEDACNTYRVTFSLLKEFEADLHLHIHLENNILFPQAIELEKKLATVLN